MPLHSRAGARVGLLGAGPRAGADDAGAQEADQAHGQGVCRPVLIRGLPARRFMVQMAQVYKRPIWLTEFACGHAGSFAALAKVLKAHITMLDSQPMVARCVIAHLVLVC